MFNFTSSNILQCYIYWQYFFPRAPFNLPLPLQSPINIQQTKGPHLAE